MDVMEPVAFALHDINLLGFCGPVFIQAVQLFNCRNRRRIVCTNVHTNYLCVQIIWMNERRPTYFERMNAAF